MVDEIERDWEVDNDGSVGDTRSDELSAQHDKEDKAREESHRLQDSSVLLPSQHETAKFYGY